MAGQVTLSRDEYRQLTPDNLPLSDWDAVVREEQASRGSLRGPFILGAMTLVLAVGGFLSWAMTTELSSASVAAGRIVVESNTKTVSHLEGGTLKELLVKEGDKVKAGDKLALLDVTRSQTILVQLRQQLFTYSAQLARLLAERDEKKVLTIDDTLPPGMDATAAANVISTEKRLFEERAELFRDQLAADESGIQQTMSQRVAMEARRRATVEQLEVVRKEFNTYEKLQAQKLIASALLNDKKLQLVDLESRIAEIDASIAESNQRKTQLELTMSNRRSDYFRAVSVEIQQTQSAIASIRQQIISAEDVVAKAVIRSPQDGTVANIKVRTPGSAVIEGTPIMDIVPANQPMLIEGTARAMDIDQIRVGQKAEIKLSAFGALELKPLIGHVTYIAPDSVVDPQTGEPRFAFKATIDEAELKAQPQLFLYPGMPAEVYIVTGNRTAMTYLAEPIERSFNNAFREQ
jgi:HlyD family secretion protein